MSDADQASYELAWENAAIDRLAALVRQHPKAAQSLIAAIYELGVDPRPNGSKRLGKSGIYRRRQVGRFRVLYAVRDEPPLVRIILVSQDHETR